MLIARNAKLPSTVVGSIVGWQVTRNCVAGQVSSTVAVCS
jgi:hypothetical protein